MITRVTSSKKQSTHVLSLLLKKDWNSYLAATHGEVRISTLGDLAYQWMLTTIIYKIINDLYFIFPSNISLFLSSLEKSQEKKPSEIIPACLVCSAISSCFKCKQGRTIQPTQQVKFCSLIVLYFGPRCLCTMYGYKVAVADGITSVI